MYVVVIAWLVCCTGMLIQYRCVGLSESIVSGSMEFLIKDTSTSSSSFPRPPGQAGAGYGADASVKGPLAASAPAVHRFHNYILSMDPMHYLRKGTPLTSSMPRLPSSWMEQWPIGKRGERRGEMSIF